MTAGGAPERPLVIPLSGLTDGDSSRVGAKAWNLFRLFRMGMPVPPGFCVPSGAYRGHLEALGAAERSAAEIREAILATPVAPALRDAIAEACRALGGPETPLAVRSSGTAEDSPGHSFAGQHDSFLNVRGLEECLAAMKRCWASLWSERAVEYRRRRGINPRSGAMAVLVQRMVDPESGGVLFTADPLTGNRDRVVIEAVEGLGETLVSGRVAPERLVLQKSDLRVLSRGGGGAAAVLDEGTARRLAALAVEIETALASPQDIEWAVAGGEPWILQARPITTIPERGSSESRQAWTNLNTAEVLPDVVTPMTWSIILPVIEKLFAVIIGGMGFDLRGAPIIGRVAGRVYFNANTVLGCLRRVPLIGRRDPTELFGGGAEIGTILSRIAPEDLPDLRFHWGRALLRFPWLLARLLIQSEPRARRLELRLRGESERVLRMDLAPASEAVIVLRIRESAQGLLDAVEPLSLAGASAFWAFALFALCRRWFSAEGEERGQATASRLLAGIGGLDDAEAGLDLWRLAALARELPGVERSISAGGGFALLRGRLEATDGGRRFLQRWDEFLERHGHHARGEIEISIPRWSESPDSILKLLGSYLAAVAAQDVEPGERAGDALPAHRARAGEENRALARECRRRLRNPLRRAFFSFILRRAQEGTRVRENLKSEVIRRLAALRRLLLELGRRLERRGAIGSPEEVFFLKLEEIDSERTAEALRSIAERRAEHERNLSLSPPPVVFGRYDPAPGSSGSPPATMEPPAGDALRLSGLAVCPGSATGRARVILRSGDDHVRPGEILVAPFTDPGWTPYFLNAAAIVMDIGGLLSHGSIVAREYGIPTVVNVGRGTKTIRTGQFLHVDGDRGVVTILPDASTPLHSAAP